MRRAMSHLPKIPSSTLTLLHNPQTYTLSLTLQPVPLPVPNSEQHLLRIRAIALTRNELTWPEPLAATPSPIPGYEISGTVLLAPPSSPFQRGSEVIARTSFERPGNAREYGIALTGELGLKPKRLAWEEAATVPLSALTAWQGLFVHGGVVAPGEHAAAKEENSGKRVLVTAAAGGVGIFAVQLAKLAGAYVVGTCGPENLEFVYSLGADEVLNYRETDLDSWAQEDDCRKFDLVLDCVGGRTLEQVWKTTKKGGMVISVAEPAEGKIPKDGVAEDVRSKWFIVEADGEHLGRLTKLIEEGKCKVVFDSAFSLEDYEKAFEKVQGGHARGKVVLRIED
ncbi:hypothetical protein BJ170DRAFT_122322 [Xylariales sp. AK1849]|nr:hypothetical protein BJ170DRAFT_122322 [Xylariales sp. AK1849]